MTRVQTVPADLLAYIQQDHHVPENVFNHLSILCTYPVRAVRMKILRDTNGQPEPEFCTVIIPAVDVYKTDKAVLKEGFLKRDALSYFISETRKVFPYGHIYKDSGYVCLGNIFVPSAVPLRSAASPLETLFLHNDRNLNHGRSELYIDKDMEIDIARIIMENQIQCSSLSQKVKSDVNIIAQDEIWNLGADVAAQKPLPEALKIMTKIFNIIFHKEREEARKNSAKPLK